ncbi:TlpA disulfide reductase family protein [Roseburia hominis]
MKIRNPKLMALMLSGILGVSVLGGCSGEKKTEEKKEVTQEDDSKEDLFEDDAYEDDAYEDEGYPDMGDETGNISTVGQFETTDIEGNAYTEKVFADYDLTLVNVLATWCSPCVQELPELQKLYEEMEGKKVGVIGIVMDTAEDNGQYAKEAIEKTKELKEKAAITFPLLVPDTGYLNGRLSVIQGYPTTFFVDKEGNIVGQTYEGSTDLEAWREVVENELANLKGEE